MKKIILSLALAFCFYGSNVKADNVFEAKSIADLLAAIESNQLTYKETGKTFGFETTQSCIFTSDDFIVLKNYCYPERPYPAKSFTIISAKFGMIDLYQESLGDNIEKRDIRINTFPEPIRKYLAGTLRDSTIESTNAIIEALYYKESAACWSTNFDYREEAPTAQCNVENVLDFDAWAQETQALTGNQDAWNKMFERVQSKLIKN